MNKILNLNSKLNNRNEIKVISLLVILIIAILIISAFSQVWSNNLNLNNPLIPEGLKSEMNAPYSTFGFTALIALVIILVLKFLKQNMLALILGIITIAFYYLIDFPLN